MKRWPVDAKLNAYGRVLRLRWKAQRVLCTLLGHKLPRPIPASRVSYWAGFAFCACDRCFEGVRVEPLQIGARK